MRNTTNFSSALITVHSSLREGRYVGKRNIVVNKKAVLDNVPSVARQLDRWFIFLPPYPQVSAPFSPKPQMSTFFSSRSLISIDLPHCRKEIMGND
jgi:hypothetical protein